VIEERSVPITPTADPEDWPHPVDEFIPASQLVEDGDQE
jgi:hypothetical protein